MRALLLSLAIVPAMLSAVPAAASDAETCAVAPAKLRSMAGSADEAVRKKVERNVAIGESLCEARNRSEGVKKFDLAAKALGTDLAALLADKTAALN